MEELGLGALPEAKKVALSHAMAESVIKRITIEVLERLSEEDRRQLLVLRDGASPLVAVEAFLKARIPDYDRLQEKILREFGEEMKATMEMLRAA